MIYISFSNKKCFISLGNIYELYIKKTVSDTLPLIYLLSAGAALIVYSCFSCITIGDKRTQQLYLLPFRK